MLALLLLALAQERAIDLLTPDRFDLRYGLGDEDFDAKCGLVDGDSSYVEFGLSWDLAPRAPALSKQDIFWALQEDRRAGDPPPLVIESPPAEEEHSCAGTSAAVGGLAGLGGAAAARYGPLALAALGARRRRKQNLDELGAL